MPKMSRNLQILISALALAIALLSGPLPGFLTPARAEVAVAPEKNPPGDIPDSQVFVDYVSAGQFALKVPEGWARSDAPGKVSFVDKLDGVSVALVAAAQAPMQDQVTATYVPAMKSAGRAIEITEIKAVTLPAGPAVLIAYTENSEPNPVTSKQVRLEANRYLLFRNGTLAALDLYAPLGADNVDQWQLMSKSFQWQ